MRRSATIRHPFVAVAFFGQRPAFFGQPFGWRVGDQRKATREVIVGTAIEPHPPSALAGDDADAVVLDLDQI